MPNESPPSPESFALVKDILAPPPPRGLAVMAPSAGGELVASWEAVKDGDLDYYTVYLSAEKGGPFKEASRVDNAARPQGRLTGLTNGMTYFVRVTASDDVPNESPPSGTVSATPLDLMPPDVPMGLTVTAELAGNALVASWIRNAEPDLGGYRILYRDGGTASARELAAVGPNETSYRHAGIVDGRTYYYSISAFDDAPVPNESPASIEVAGTPADAMPPGPPLNVTAELADGSSVLVSWVAPTEQDLAGFAVYQATPGGWSEVGRVGAMTGEYRVVGLSPGEYTFAVSSLDEVPNESERTSGPPIMVPVPQTQEPEDKGADEGKGDAGYSLMLMALAIIALLLVVVIALLVQLRAKKAEVESIKGRKPVLKAEMVTTTATPLSRGIAMTAPMPKKPQPVQLASKQPDRLLLPSDTRRAPAKAKASASAPATQRAPAATPAVAGAPSAASGAPASTGPRAPSAPPRAPVTSSPAAKATSAAPAAPRAPPTAPRARTASGVDGAAGAPPAGAKGRAGAAPEARVLGELPPED